MVAGQDVRLQFGERTGELYTSRASADDDDSHQAIALRRIGDDLSALVVAEDAGADGHRVPYVVHADRVCAGGFDAEVVRRAAGGDDEIVVGDLFRFGHDDAAIEIDAIHGGEAEAHILHVAHDGSDGLGDIVGVEACARDLVEKRDEGVVVVAIEKEDVDWLIPQAACGLQAAESGSDDHHPGPRGICDRFHIISIPPHAQDVNRVGARHRSKIAMAGRLQSAANGRRIEQCGSLTRRG